MIKIQDIRSDNSKQLKDIEPNGFFYYDDVLYRRVIAARGAEIRTLTTNGEDDIPVLVQATGELIGMNRLCWVEPIADRQVFLEISD